MSCNFRRALSNIRNRLSTCAHKAIFTRFSQTHDRSRFNYCHLGILDRPVKPGDDSACVAADTASRPRGAFRPSFASSLRPETKRAQGRPGAGGTRGPLRERHTQEEPHSSIQVKPNTRPSLRDGRTAYAVLSREPSSFWPPSPWRKSPAPRRLTRVPHPPGLDRSDDGQDHTVLPYARPAGATGSDGVVHVAIGM